MKTYSRKSILFGIRLASTFLLAAHSFAGSPTSTPNHVRSTTIQFNLVDDLIGMLNQMADASDNQFFKRHCDAIVSVIQAKQPLTQADSTFLEAILNPKWFSVQV
jgi:hypothetical protein